MNDDLWQQILTDLSMQMPVATFETWLRNSRIVHTDGDQITIAVANEYAADWLENRLKSTIQRTVDRILGRPVEIAFIVSDNGQSGDTTGDTTEPDVSPDCRIAVELINYDPITAGFVMTSNYALQYWQPYLATIEREHGARNTGIAFSLWYTLRSFPAAWQATGRSHWPSIYTLADMVAGGSRFKILGRKPHGERSSMVGALEILEREHIAWPKIYGSGRETVYYFRVLDILPLLTPAQVARLSQRLQERHALAFERCKLDYAEWEQLSLPTLLEDR